MNCAGTSVAAPFDALPINQFERMMNINYLGAVYVTRAVIGGMKRKGEGRIVFVASQAAQATLHGYSAYGASKWALRGLAEALQMEVSLSSVLRNLLTICLTNLQVKPFGIYVSVAYPPDTDTPGYEIENLTKPSMTQKLSESGSVFSAQQVASDIVTQSGKRYFGITTGFDVRKFT